MREAFSGETFKVATFIDDYPNQTVSDTRFQECEFVGPAVMQFPGTNFVGCKFGIWEDDIESILWDIHNDRPVIVGGVMFKDCEFVNCLFRGIGFASSDPEEMKRLRHLLRGATS